MNDFTVKSDVELAHYAQDMLDKEAEAIFKVVYAAQMKYQYRPNTVEVLEELRDELLTKLMEIGILATVDPAPCFYGEPPIVEIIGKVADDAIHKHGFDHEQKQWEVRKAIERNEDYYGQKE